MRLVCLSDTHGLHTRMPPVPDGDVLVHAGDLTGRGTLPEVAAGLRWLASLPHRHKLFVAGNHDWLFERDPGLAATLCREHRVRYLRDNGGTIGGLRVWGSPWQPAFMGWAFNLPRGGLLAARWALIPRDTDVLVTHGPPAGVRDEGYRAGSVGCADLRARLTCLPRLRLHVFGHVHEGAGVTEPADAAPGPVFVNAAICTRAYAPINPPVVVDL